jgi:PAS domain S-box-containing protein
MAANRRNAAEGLPDPPPWLNAAYSRVPLPVCVTHQRRLVWVNPEFEDFYGRQLKEIQGMGMKDVVVTSTQLSEQQPSIQRLKKSLDDQGVGIRHFLNKSKGREVGVLVVAFEVQHDRHPFSIAIAIPDSLNDLLRLLIRSVVTDDFDEARFLKSLTGGQKTVLRKFSEPRASAKEAGGSTAKNGARDKVSGIRNKLTCHGWMRTNVEFSVHDLKLLAMALGPLLQHSLPAPAKKPSSTRRMPPSKSSTALAKSAPGNTKGLAAGPASSRPLTRPMLRG